MGEIWAGDTLLKTMQCQGCGVWHAIPKVTYDSYRRSGGFWHCPNGCERGWIKGAEQEEINRLRRANERLVQREAMLNDEIEHEKRRGAAARGQVTKLKNRAAAGVCPCCKRSFSNLRKHMQSKHPEYGKEAAE